MEQPKFLIGSEKRFADFIKSLESAKKIICVSHTDLDGVVSAKVVDFSLDGDKVLFVNYGELNEAFVEKLKKEKPSHVVFTDLFMKKEFVEKIGRFAYVLVIDHHIPEEDYNSDKVFFINSSGAGVCASYMAFYLFSKISDLSKIDWLVACACISDFCYKPVWTWMEEVAKKYGDIFKGGMMEGVDSGKLWDLQWKLTLALNYYTGKEKEVYDNLGEKFEEIGNLNRVIKEVQEDFDKSLEKFIEERVVFSGGYFWEVNTKFAIKSLLASYLSVKEPKKIFVFGRADQGEYYISARRQDGKDNMSEMLKKLTSGLINGEAGGHLQAAGAHFPLKYKSEFLKRLKSL